VTHDDWMRALAEHLDRVRLSYPGDELVLVFDIDGTIVDSRHLVVHALLAYDRDHGTDHFRGITAEDVSDHESLVDEIIDPFALPEPVRHDVRAWYLDLPRSDAVAASHLPTGCLSDRWFQLQPATRIDSTPGASSRCAATHLAEQLGVAQVAFDPSSCS
jgi:hypothetical protein